MQPCHAKGAFPNGLLPISFEQGDAPPDFAILGRYARKRTLSLTIIQNLRKVLSPQSHRLWLPDVC